MDTTDPALPVTNDDIIPKKPLNRGPSSFVKAGVGLLTTAVIDVIVAFSTPYWATWNNPDKGEYGGYGLWMMWTCTIHEAQDDCIRRVADFTSPFPGWYVTVQVFMTLALAGIVFSLVMLLLYIFLQQCHKNKAMLSALIALSYLSGLFIMVALFVFGFKVAEEIEDHHIEEWILSWSFSLTCTAFLLNQIAASVLITENKRLYKEQQSDNGILAQMLDTTDDEEMDSKLDILVT